MKKQVLAGALAASIAAVSIAGASLAYFTDKDAKDNVFTVGNVSIVLTEPKWDVEGAAEAQDMYPGEAVAKDPTVTNDGRNPAFVRVKVDFPEDVKMTYETGTDYSENNCNENWVKIGDYFYYTQALAAGDSTPAVFDRVRLDANAGNELANGELHVNVTAEAIQAQGIFPSYSVVEDGLSEDELNTIVDIMNATDFNA